jgi:hypothetical protein
MVVALFFKVEGSCGMFSGWGRDLRRLRTPENMQSVDY